MHVHVNSSVAYTVIKLFRNLTIGWEVPSVYKTVNYEQKQMHTMQFVLINQWLFVILWGYRILIKSIWKQNQWCWNLLSTLNFNRVKSTLMQWVNHKAKADAYQSVWINQFLRICNRSGGMEYLTKILLELDEHAHILAIGWKAPSVRKIDKLWMEELIIIISSMLLHMSITMKCINLA